MEANRINPAASSIRCAMRSSGRTSRAARATRLGAERPRPRRGRPPGMEQRRGGAADPGRTTRRRPVWSSARLRSARLRSALRRAAQPPFGGGGGGSFLGTAAAAAAGVVGGSLLLGSIRSMMGGGSHQQAFGDTSGHRGSIEDRRPTGDQSGSDLARDAGINDIGSSGSSRTGLFDSNDSNDGSRAGFFDSASNDDDGDHDSDGFDDDAATTTRPGRLQA